MHFDSIFKALFSFFSKGNPQNNNGPVFGSSDCAEPIEIQTRQVYNGPVQQNRQVQDFLLLIPLTCCSSYVYGKLPLKLSFAK